MIIDRQYCLTIDLSVSVTDHQEIARERTVFNGNPGQCDKYSDKVGLKGSNTFFFSIFCFPLNFKFIVQEQDPVKFNLFN